MNVKEIKDEEIIPILSEIFSRGFFVYVEHEDGEIVEGIVEGVREDEDGVIYLTLNQ
jgi:hypothetical protein